MESLFKEELVPEVSKVRKRKKRKASKAVFIDCRQNQSMLLPPSLEELIPEEHLVRVVNSAINKLDLSSLLESYKGGGRSAYDPAMMLKVLVYSYLSKVYSSRRIAKALREDVNFMWISGMNKPDFRTINNFRSGRLKDSIDKVFTSMLIFLMDNKLVKLENYFVDGTKLDANANKHTYVWASNTARYKASTVKKIEELLKQIKKINDEENKSYGDHDLEETGDGAEPITSEKLKEQVNKLNEIIKNIGDKEPEKKKKLNQAANKIKKTLIPKLEKYEQQEGYLEGRGSYSKTDKDATFFLNKANQLLPGYNVIIGTENQIIVNYNIYRKPSDSDNFIDHVENFNSKTNSYPQRVIGDGAYGTEENYKYIEAKGIENYLKYREFNREQTGGFTDKPYHKSHFEYNEKKDEYRCPKGKRLEFFEEAEVKTKTGYIQTIRKYKGIDCKVCDQYDLCCKSKEQPRTLQTSWELESYKEQARDNLLSEAGTKLRIRRSTDVETVFADIKQNQGYRRFILRGMDKVNVEFGLLSIAHNLKKVRRWS
jgi:transposase